MLARADGARRIRLLRVVVAVAQGEDGYMAKGSSSVEDVVDDDAAVAVG